jgi:hypothetical protein
MKTLFNYEVTDFQKLDEPIYVIGQKLPMIYKGVVHLNESNSDYVNWNKLGLCANLMFNDYFLNLKDLDEWNKEQLKKL